jgi:hypothetical protein
MESRELIPLLADLSVSTIWFSAVPKLVSEGPKPGENGLVAVFRHDLQVGAVRKEDVGGSEQQPITHPVSINEHRNVNGRYPSTN